MPYLANGDCGFGRNELLRIPVPQAGREGEGGNGEETEQIKENEVAPTNGLKIKGPASTGPEGCKDKGQDYFRTISFFTSVNAPAVKR